MADFKKLHVWRKSHALALDTFKVCSRMQGFPDSLVRNQLLRSIVSVPANIAEGSAKQSDADFARFLRIALGSLTESEYHLVLASDLRLVPPEDARRLQLQLVDVRKMLSGFVKTLRTGKTRAVRDGEQVAGSW